MRPLFNYRIKNAAADEIPEIVIYDQIGLDWWTGEGVTAKRFREDLAALGQPPEMSLRINSEGGSVFEGFAIYNALKEFSAKGTRIVVTIDAAAMSIATVIAMAGDEIRAQANATYMIHDAWTIVMGDASELRKQADLLEKLSGQIADVYAARTGRPVDELKALMKAETWWTAAEAKENKFVDVVLENKQAPQPVSDQMLRTVRNAPAWVKQRQATSQAGLLRLLQAKRFHRQAAAEGDEPAKKKPVLVVDFDGVLHSYESGWQGADVVADGPVDGAAQFLADAAEKFEVNILSSRSHQAGGIDAMKSWLKQVLADAEQDEGLLDRIQWPTNKPSATVTLDDRAWTFNGTFPAVADLLAFQPWNKK